MSLYFASHQWTAKRRVHGRPVPDGLCIEIRGSSLIPALMFSGETGFYGSEICDVVGSFMTVASLVNRGGPRYSKLMRSRSTA